MKEQELDKVIAKLCSLLSVDKSTRDFTVYSYRTPTQEQEFIDWLCLELYNNSKLRKEFSNFSFKSKKLCEKLSDEFNNNYGPRSYELK